MKVEMNRRTFLAGIGVAGMEAARLRAAAPASPVAVAKCKQYGDEFLAAAGKMFDQLGGLGSLVKGKTVAIKINLTGGPGTRFDDRPAGRTHWSHPRTVGAVIHLLDKAGARRIRVLFDPQADRGTPPLERCDSTLRLAEEHGVGTRDLQRIEVIGTSIAEARFRFRDVEGPAPGGPAPNTRG